MNAVVLFARSPEREAAAKRMRSAAPLFRALVAAWLASARRFGCVPLIACAPEDREALARIAPHIARGWIAQRGATFGARVANAADDAFARGFGAVVLSAIDAPPHDLAIVLESLSRGVAVLAPAADGGVNFIGLTSPDRALLENLTTQRCREHFDELLVVETTTDIDSHPSIAAARNERVWRAYLERPALFSHAPARALRGVSRFLPPRAPPLVA